MAKKIIVLFVLCSLIAVPFLKVKEARAIPSGVGVLGDSGSEPYRCISARSETSFNWSEVLELVRGIDFGPGECQAYNKAQSGESLRLHMYSQTTSLLADFNAGNIGKVIIMHGFNDLYENPDTPDVPALLTEYRRNVQRLLDAGMAPENILIVDISQENWAEPIRSMVDQFNAGLKDYAEEIGAAFGTFVAFHAELACRISADQQSYNYGGHAISQQWGNEWFNFRVSDGHLNTLPNGTLANTTMLEFLGISRMSDTELLAIMNVQANNPGPNCDLSGTQTTTNITSDLPDPSTLGQAVTVMFTVSASSGTPSGNVTISDGVNSCTGTVATGSCSITLTTGGARTLTATYAGSGGYASSSDTEAHTVNKANTTTAITSDSPDPSVAGQPVTVSYTVTSSSGTPTGNVTVSDGVSSCTGTVAAGSCSIALTTTGARTLTASYAGNSSFNSSTSAGVAHTVNQAGTTTTITGDSPDASVVGQAVTVNYTVAANAPGGGTPGGNVTVTDSASAATCTGTVAAGNCTITFTTAGARTLTASYAGNSSYAGSSDSEAHTVNKANTTTTITGDSPDPSALNQAVTVNYTVAATAPGGGTPVGNVTVSDGVDSCTGTVAAGNCSITLTTGGVRTLTATYVGNDDYASSSDAETHTINENGTTTTITSDSPDPSLVAQAVTVKFTVVSGGGTPTGNVTVSDGLNSCVGTVAAGACNLTLMAAGPRILTATYEGDSNFGGSISADEEHLVVSKNSLLSVAAQDGWLLESGETSNKGKTLNKTASTFFLGDDAQKKQYRSILSFTTKDLPDNAFITKVTLKVKRQGVVGGGNPVNTFQGFLVDIKKGFFGSAAGLQAGDFQANGQSYGPFKPALSAGWYSIDLTPAKAYINKLNTNGGVTQVRLRFKLDDNNNAKANYLSLYSGNATTASRPQLIIEYYVP